MPHPHTLTALPDTHAHTDPYADTHPEADSDTHARAETRTPASPAASGADTAARGAAARPHADTDTECAPRAPEEAS
ncbi:hypothetical protein GCM10011579_020930 [Streptomyces albiflavescens]|uniref:Uncharacterized protein n=1 Tax=Streptomyces albiflavescens TaxID=1623582 RepID=A0A918D1I8_9ACTN|nr:hypothetical protein GCM10011579_020930 [Streptomyces albiflavescens]